MDNFTYYAPTKVVFGRNAEAQVGKLIGEGGFKKVLLHYGGGSIKHTGLFDRVTNALNQAGIAYIALGGAEPNPKIGLVREGAALCRKEGVDFILAVGGGSVLDSAKGIAVGAKQDGDVWALYEKGGEIKAAIPVGSILTISAAGSEMSRSSVVSNPESRLKRDINSDLIRPLFAIMNPELTFTVSPYQTACGIVDIMMHTFERYFTNTKNVDLTDRISEGLIRAVIDAGAKAVANPEDYEARATLMWASSISHNGLTGTGRAGDWASHQLEHEISGLYDHVAHGAGLAVVFPAWSRYVYRHDLPRFKRYAVEIWGVDATLEEEEAALEGIARTRRYFKEIGMPLSFADLKITGEQIALMAEKATAGDTQKVGGFVPLSKADAVEIYKLAL